MTPDVRPDECRCDGLGGSLPCWVCWRDGWRETAGETPESDANETTEVVAGWTHA